MRRVLLACVLAACGSNHAAPADGSIDPPRDGSSTIDAPPDAPPVASLIVQDAGGTTVTTVTLPDAYPATTSSSRVFVYNSSATPSTAITATITGSDAASFSLDAANSTCGPPLAAHDGCWIQIAFSPTSAGTKSATLHVDGGGEPLAIALEGISPALPAMLVTDVASVDFGTLNRGDSKVMHVLLENAGSTTVTLGARTATAPFQYASDNCPATLTSGSACTIDLAFTAANPGLFTGALGIASDANSLSVPLTVTVLRMITVANAGDGTGTITSTPAGISCPGTCSASFPLGVSVSLTATPDPGNVFTHWDGICSGTGTCTIDPPGDGAAYPRFFLASDKRIDITTAGMGSTVVDVTAPSAIVNLYDTCFGSCTIYVPSGTQVTLKGYSSSTFVGWTGDCTSSTYSCSLGTVVNDRAVTATSNIDPYEAATLHPLAAVTGIAVTSTGDLIVASSTAISKVTITGTVAWSTPLANVSGLVVDATDEIFAVGTSTLTKLTAAGASVWSQDVTAYVASYAYNPAISVSPDGSVIAVLTTDGMRVLDGSGADRFAIAGIAGVSSVAVAPDGTIALGRPDLSIGDVFQADRYMPDGTPLTPFAPVIGENFLELVYDATNALCTFSHGEGFATVSRLTTAGMEVFRQRESIQSGSPKPSGVLATPAGDVARVLTFPELASGARMNLEVYSATGTLLHTITKPALETNEYTYPNARWIAAGGTNRIAIAGKFFNHPWIQVLDLP